MGGHGPALRGCLAAKESEEPVGPFLSVFESPGATGFGSRDRGGGGGGVSARLPATPVGGSRQQLGAPPPPARPGSGSERGCARERRAQAPPGGVSAPPGGGVGRRGVPQNLSELRARADGRSGEAAAAWAKRARGRTVTASPSSGCERAARTPPPEPTAAGPGAAGTEDFPERREQPRERGRPPASGGRDRTRRPRRPPRGARRRPRAPREPQPCRARSPPSRDKLFPNPI
ncbi:basic salivary proline-rich protein 4-like [Hyaena hyaena]|uniref:basic salivary proline-rich protein 4-like n=1 Tax=Hyaena hyaena TaxID=95912 RepID=UPI0019213E0D|nr:basic salivary proline-rich protein 4-like [Hyaena hyaena]